MKSTKLLVTGYLAITLGLGANAQILNSTMPELTNSTSVQNTGLAIAPNLNLHAAVYSSGATYVIDWIDETSGTVVDSDGNTGADPDVAYYASPKVAVVAYENGGAVFLDEFYLAVPPPFTNYFLGATALVATNGTYPNVDINSFGDGILCWENAGVVYACSYAVGSVTPGPALPIGAGSMPDIILLDDGFTAALTYVDPSGLLVIQTMDYWALASGSIVTYGIWGFPFMTGYQYPRIASQRNAAFGPADDFTVVAQDFDGFTTHVHAFFANFGMVSMAAIANINFLGCPTFNPYPVVAYDRNEIHVAWSQDYLGGCSGMAEWPAANNNDDVLLANFDLFGNAIPMTTPPAGAPWPVQYEEVNNVNTGGFAGISYTSIATEYDGFFGITATNYHEGVLFSDPSQFYWKHRNIATPTFINEGGITSERESVFTLISSPVEETIEIVSTSDAPATFELIDNAGRIVEVKKIESNGNSYSLNIQHLSGGTYFLKCSSTASEEIVKILHVTN